MHGSMKYGGKLKGIKYAHSGPIHQRTWSRRRSVWRREADRSVPCSKRRSVAPLDARLGLDFVVVARVQAAWYQAVIMLSVTIFREDYDNWREKHNQQNTTGRDSCS
jgi:hypothetical protein